MTRRFICSFDGAAVARVSQTAVAVVEVRVSVRIAVSSLFRALVVFFAFDEK